jgi:hypothetical protein
MIILGAIRLVIGLVAKIPILVTIGLIVTVIGAALFILGSMGRAVGGRRHSGDPMPPDSALTHLKGPRSGSLPHGERSA